MSAARAYPAPGVVRRERGHRRAVAAGLAVLLVLGTAPLLVPLLSAGLAVEAHLWALCRVALRGLLAPVHGGFHLLLLAGLAYAAWDRVRGWRAQRRALGALRPRTATPGDPFGRAAAAVGVPLAALRIVPGLPTPAFTAGWARPRIYLAAELATRLPAAELEAVLAHEGAHARRRDPLRLSLLRFLACALFWLPAVGRLAEDIADEAEVRADDDAARGRPLALASALLALSQWMRPARPVHDGVGFDDRDLLVRRVRRLAGEEVAPRTRLTRGSLAGAATVLALAWGAGVLGAAPHAGEGTSHPAHGVHCRHEGESAFRHLFCLGFSAPAPRTECTHA